MKYHVKKIKKTISLSVVVAIALATSLVFVACGKSRTLLNPRKPTTLTMWHVYGEQVDSPMNVYVEQFNSTTGKEKGIVINVALMSNASQIGKKLKDAQTDKAGSKDMPDLFFCHAGDAKSLGTDNLLDWKNLLPQKDLGEFVPSFLNDGTVDNSLCVLPVSKSTYMLFIAGGVFDRFAAEKNVSLSDLETWEGFFSVAGKYYEWSGGKPFCAIDYLIRLAELCAISDGENISYKDGWYDANNPAFISAYDTFAESIAKGHIVVSDMYSNTQVMTGEVAGGMGSSASILYYNDTVTYPDNTTEPMDLQILPMPRAAGGKMLASQAGVGLCALKTTAQKQEAISVFAHWLTDSDRNLAFAAQTGYMPVTYDAFDAIKDYDFNNAAFASLYQTFTQVQQSARILSEPSFAGFYGKTGSLYEALRAKQKDYAKRSAGGADTEQLSEQTWKLFKGIS